MAAVPQQLFDDDDDVGIDPEQFATIERLIEGGDEDLLTEEELRVLQMHFASGVPASEHGANLAEHLDGPALAAIAQDVCQWYEDDLSSLSEWREREQRGMRALGVSPNVDGGAAFEGASTVVHPMLAEAVIQFNARTMGEVWPAEGPVRTKIVGEADRERREQSQRVADYLNYLYTTEMPDAYDEEDRLTFRLPLSGSMFKKFGWDPDYGQFRCWAIEPSHLVVPYSATSLLTTPRYTEVIYMQHRDVLRRMRDGYYMQVPLQPREEGFGRTELDDEMDAVEGRTQSSTHDDDERHTILECNAYYDLPGFEDINPRTGELSEIGLPYLLTIDYDSQEVLAVRRNWREQDRRQHRRVWHIHKKFFPGFGFYGFGLYHLAGGLADSATGALRALLDSAQFSNLQGGFRSRDMRLAGSRDMAKNPAAPGEWIEVEAPAEDIAKGFHPHKYGEPSEVLLTLLGVLDEKGQRLLSTTEAMVGEFKANMPVGTTLALIEQGSRVYSGIHKRMHEANAQEYRLVGELVGEYLPRDAYPYEMGGVPREVLRSDFDRRIDVIPVSDPNTVTGTHRIVQAQTVLQLSDSAPEIYDRVATHRYMLESLRVPNPDRFLKDPKVRQRQDPVSEGMAMMMGQPAHAFPEQDHAAHIEVHANWFGTLPEELQQMLMPVHQAHIAEHLAWAYRIKVQERLGMALPMPQHAADDDEQPELPPEVEAQLSARIAQAVQTFEDEQQRFPPPEPPEVVEAKQKAAIAEQAAGAEQERKQAAHDAEMARRRDEADRKAALEIEERARQDELARERAGMEADALQRRHDEELAFMQRKHDIQIEQMREEGIERSRIEEERAALKIEMDYRAAEQKREQESRSADQKREQDAAKAADDAKRREGEQSAAAQSSAPADDKLAKRIERIEQAAQKQAQPDPRIDKVLKGVGDITKAQAALEKRLDDMERRADRRRKAVAEFAKKEGLAEVGEFIAGQEKH
jgi:hypothetical protein